MNQFSFKITPHSRKTGVEILEILLDGVMVATIYPDDRTPKSIKLVSAHFAGELTHSNNLPDGVKMNTGEKIIPPIPALHLTFDPRPYDIRPNRIVRV